MTNSTTNPPEESLLTKKNEEKPAFVCDGKQCLYCVVECTVNADKREPDSQKNGLEVLEKEKIRLS